MSILKKADKILTQINTVIGVAAFIGVALSVCLGVVARWLNLSIMWTEEVSRYFLVWFVYTAVVTGYEYVEKTSVEMLFNKFPAKVRLIARAIYRVIMIVFLLIVMRYGIDFAILGLSKRLVTLPIPIFWARLAIPFGCLMMSIKWAFLIIFSLSPNSGDNTEEEEKKLLLE